MKNTHSALCVFLLDSGNALTAVQMEMEMKSILLFIGDRMSSNVLYIPIYMRRWCVMIFHFYRSLMCGWRDGSNDIDQFDKAPNKYRQFLYPSLLFFLRFHLPADCGMFTYKKRTIAQIHVQKNDGKAFTFI